MGRHHESSRGHRSDRDNGDSRRHRSDRYRDDKDRDAVDRGDGGSRHHRRHSHRDNDDRRGDRNDNTNGSRSSRRHSHSERRRRYDDNNSDDYDNDTQRGRKRRRGGDDSEDSDRGDASGSRRGRTHREREAKHEAANSHARRQVSPRDEVTSSAVAAALTTTTTAASATNSTSAAAAAAPAPPMDWSSRRGRQRMPTSAYDANQQKRLLGFLDGRGGAQEMTFNIGPDGLVQMPPPNTLVRHRPGSARTRDHPAVHSGGNSVGGADHAAEADDDTHSVASHESLYDDPVTAHRGVLADVFPPSHLYRVALYGVELAVTARHLSSIVVQLLGTAAKPYRVRRPAREMLHAAMAQAASIATAPEPRKAAAPSSSGVLHDDAAHEEEPHQLSSSNSPSNDNNNAVNVAGGVLDAEAEEGINASLAESAGVLAPIPSSGVLHDTPGVLGEDGAEAGVLDSAAEHEDHHDDAAENVVEESGILPDAATLPVPDVAAFYLPGLHDVSGPGGMVVLEFAEHEHAVRAVQVLNGGFVNGRRIAASM